MHVQSACISPYSPQISSSSRERCPPCLLEAFGERELRRAIRQQSALVNRQSPSDKLQQTAVAPGCGESFPLARTPHSVHCCLQQGSVAGFAIYRIYLAFVARFTSTSSPSALADANPGHRPGAWAGAYESAHQWGDRVSPTRGLEHRSELWQRPVLAAARQRLRCAV